MDKSISILNKDYRQWVKELCSRYRQSQIKAAVKVNVEQLRYNWLLGRDIVEMHVEERWGESVIIQLSKDLREAIPNAVGLSKSNIYYCRKFYLLYKDTLRTFHQVGGILEIPCTLKSSILQMWKELCQALRKLKQNWAMPTIVKPIF